MSNPSNTLYPSTTLYPSAYGVVAGVGWEWIDSDIGEYVDTLDAEWVKGGIDIACSTVALVLTEFIVDISAGHKWWTIFGKPDDMSNKIFFQGEDAHQ